MDFVYLFSTPMMDLLVQAASLNKLNPSGYSLVVLDSNQHVIHFKPNQTVGQIGEIVEEIKALITLYSFSPELSITADQR